MNPMVLIVEDNPDNMKLLTWLLEDEGYTVTGASTAARAFEVLREQPVTAVLMDISLPDSDGMEATRRLRADPQFANLPVIAVTAHAVAEKADAIWASGVSALITKPVDEAALLDTLRNLLASAAR